MDKEKLENIEINLLLDAILKQYGYDFRNYSPASRKRRIKHFLGKTEYSKISEMIPRLLYDAAFFNFFIYDMSITVTEMFRDPPVYQVVRTQVIPLLKTYPFIKIWHAGCATGEEVYSMAIVLKEEGIYDKVQIYATDFNDSALEKAKAGVFPVDPIRTYTANYQKSGGKSSFSEYYHSKYNSVIMRRHLKENITFAVHNLVTDASFGEMHLILCRNVMIYFDKILQDRVLNLFDNSLIINGFLCLGTKESLHFSTIAQRYREIADHKKIYRKKQDD